MMPRRRTIWTCALSLAVTLSLNVTLGAAMASAADIRWLRLDSSHAVYEVLFGAQFRNMGVDYLQNTPMRQMSLLVGERLGGWAAGSVLHPRFLTFNAGLSVLAMQQSRSGYATDNAGFINTTRVEYKAAATLRKESTAPLFVTAERGIDIIRRDFVPNYDLLRTSHGANWIWQNPFAPLSLGIAKTTLEYGLGDPGYGADDLLQASANIRRKQLSSDMALEYRMQDYTNAAKSWLTYQSHDGLASYIWRSDPCQIRRYEADTNLRFTRRSTVGDRDQWLGNLTGTLWWSDALTTRGGYRYLQQESPESSLIQHTGWLDARYRLYRSLTVGATLQSGTRALPDGQRMFGAAATDVNYTKKFGRFGTMSQLWQQTYYTERGDKIGGVREVLGEPHLLSTQEPATLDHERVIRSTIKVIDATTLKQYVETTDYILFEAGQRTTIRRAVGSTIPEGAALRVDYSYEEAIGPGLTSYDNRWVARHSVPVGQDVVTYAEISERWTNRWVVGQPYHVDRFETLTLGGTGRWKMVDTTLEARRWTAQDLRVTEASLMLATTQTLGPLRASVGNRGLVQWMAADTWYNYEAFTDGTMPIGDKVAVGGRFRYLARSGMEGLAQTLDGDAYGWWQWRQVRIRLDYRVQATWRAENGTQNHRIFISLGRPM